MLMGMTRAAAVTTRPSTILIGYSTTLITLLIIIMHSHVGVPSAIEHDELLLPAEHLPAYVDRQKSHLLKRTKIVANMTEAAKAELLMAYAHLQLDRGQQMTDIEGRYAALTDAPQARIDALSAIAQAHNVNISQCALTIMRLVRRVVLDVTHPLQRVRRCYSIHNNNYRNLSSLLDHFAAIERRQRNMTRWIGSCEHIGCVRTIETHFNRDLHRVPSQVRQFVDQALQEWRDWLAEANKCSNDDIQLELELLKARGQSAVFCLTNALTTKILQAKDAEVIVAEAMLDAEGRLPPKNRLHHVMEAMKNHEEADYSFEETMVEPSLQQPIQILQASKNYSAEWNKNDPDSDYRTLARDFIRYRHTNFTSAD